MEYFVYILIILGIMGVCHYLMRDPEQYLERDVMPKPLKNERVSSARKDDKKNKTVTEPASAVQTLNRESCRVPTPWGWPGHGKSATQSRADLPNAREVHDVSESLHRFVDHLISEKQTVENMDYLLKKNASLRALMEDRYGRVLAKSETKFIRSHKGRSAMPKLLEVKTPWGW